MQKKSICSTILKRKEDTVLIQLLEDGRVTANGNLIGKVVEKQYHVTQLIPRINAVLVSMAQKTNGFIPLYSFRLETWIDGKKLQEIVLAPCELLAIEEFKSVYNVPSDILVYCKKID